MDLLVSDVFEALTLECWSQKGRFNPGHWLHSLQGLREQRMSTFSESFSALIAPSTVGLLVDGNDDTFPVYTQAKDLNYIFDFGSDFRFSAVPMNLSRMLFLKRNGPFEADGLIKPECRFSLTTSDKFGGTPVYPKMVDCHVWF
jgi:hypothetical protein